MFQLEVAMKTRIAALIFTLLVSPAFAADGSITISSPANDAEVKAGNDVSITYEAVLGPNGDHLHLYLDGKRIDILHQTKGGADVGRLAPGKHEICLEVNSKAHVPTGVRRCIDVTAK